MIRDRLKSAARKVLLKAFNMEWDASPSAGPPPANPDVDFETQRSYIPPIVQGSGDTPGPNHRENIGRTWLAAQVASGAGPILIDIRPPKECVAGMLPGAMLFPGDQLKQNLQVLPDKGERVVIYDQIGSDESGQLAEWLREQGWGMARKLVGGYAEWIEHDEPISVPQPPAGARYHVGHPVEDKQGNRGHVQQVTPPAKDSKGEKSAQYLILLDNGKLLGPIAETALRA